MHDGVYEVEVRDGIPQVRPPAWVDPLRRWRRNPLHHNVSPVTRTIEQLVLALGETDDFGDLATGAAGSTHPGAGTGELGMSDLSIDGTGTDRAA